MAEGLNMDGRPPRTARVALAGRAGSFATWWCAAASWLACSRPVDSGPPTRRNASDRARPAVTAVANPAVQVAAGANHTCARMADGTVHCWGSNNCGQLGAPAPDSCRYMITGFGLDRPFPCRDTPGRVDLVGVAEIAVADTASCARMQDGTVRCWGCSANALTGGATTPNKFVPTVMPDLSGVVQLVMTSDHACVRFADGGVLCWGNNRYGQLGILTATGGVAARVPGLNSVVDVAVGDRLTCVRLATRELICFGQLGYHEPGSVAPRTIPELNAASELALGAGGHCGRLADGSLRCVGSSFATQALGASGSPLDASAPAIGLNSVSNLVLNGPRGCAVVGAGEVRCWGAFGATGVPPIRAPQRFDLPIAATHVTLGFDHGCAIGRDGSVWCWGAASFGEAGSRDAATLPINGFWTPPRRVWP